MQMIELLRQRRSIRRFTEHPIGDDTIHLLEETLLRAPSSRGINPWEFILVDDRELLQKLSQAKPHGAALLQGATLAVVICADESRSDVWVEDCSIAAITVQLVAQSLGIASCWVQVRKRQHASGQSSEDYVRQLLRIPEPLRVASMVALGYLATAKTGHPAETLDRNKIHRNGFTGPT